MHLSESLVCWSDKVATLWKSDAAGNLVADRFGQEHNIASPVGIRVIGEIWVVVDDRRNALRTKFQVHIRNLWEESHLSVRRILLHPLGASGAGHRCDRLAVEILAALDAGVARRHQRSYRAGVVWVREIDHLLSLLCNEDA